MYGRMLRIFTVPSETTIAPGRGSSSQNSFGVQTAGSSEVPLKSSRNTCRYPRPAIARGSPKVGASVSSSSVRPVQPGSAGKSTLPSPSLSVPSAHAAGGGGGGGGGGAFVSSSSFRPVQPGSAGKSTLPSPSLSVPSAHAAGGG